MDAIHLSLRGEPDNCDREPKFVQPLGTGEGMAMQRAADTTKDAVKTEWVSDHTTLPLTFTPKVKLGQSKFHDDSSEEPRLQELGAASDIQMSHESIALSKQPAITPSNAGSSASSHICSICGKNFMTVVTLNNHFKTHSKAKPHICKECNRSFRQMSNLIQHRRIHTGERPYNCQYCEKSFKQKSQVMQHERLHTGEKPYVCSHCQRAFVQLSQLKYHEKTHRNKDAVSAGDEKYTKGKRSRKRKVQENTKNSSVDDVSPVYILTDEDMSSGTISAQL